MYSTQHSNASLFGSEPLSPEYDVISSLVRCEPFMLDKVLPAMRSAGFPLEWGWMCLAKNRALSYQLPVFASLVPDSCHHFFTDSGTSPFIESLFCFNADAAETLLDLGAFEHREERLGHPLTTLFCAMCQKPGYNNEDQEHAARLLRLFRSRGLFGTSEDARDLLSGALLFFTARQHQLAASWGPSVTNEAVGLIDDLMKRHPSMDFQDLQSAPPVFSELLSTMDGFPSERFSLAQLSLISPISIRQTIEKTHEYRKLIEFSDASTGAIPFLFKNRHMIPEVSSYLRDFLSEGALRHASHFPKTTVELLFNQRTSAVNSDLLEILNLLSTTGPFDDFERRRALKGTLDVFRSITADVERHQLHESRFAPSFFKGWQSEIQNVPMIVSLYSNSGLFSESEAGLLMDFNKAVEDYIANQGPEDYALLKSSIEACLLHTESSQPKPSQRSRI